MHMGVHYTILPIFVYKKIKFCNKDKVVYSACNAQLHRCRSHITSHYIFNESKVGAQQSL